MKKNTGVQEFRSSGVQEYAARVNESNLSVGDWHPPLIDSHQIENLVGVLNPVIQTPVGLQFILNSDD